MREWYEENRKRAKLLYDEYGKVFFVLGCLVVIFISIVLIFNFVSTQKLKVSFLDIGQGDAILIQTPSGKEMLVDGGPTNVILERLSHELSFFDNNIDVMVATHPDADHVTGLIPVLAKYKVDKIITSPKLGDTGIFKDLEKNIEDENAEMHVAQTGDEIDFHDGVVAKILWPPADYVPKKNDTNDASVSMMITYGRESFLLTGDLPSVEEPNLISVLLSLRQSQLPGSEFTNSESADSNITVYKAGHHGSKYSSGEQLLTYIRPEYAVISAGKDNKYGHPNEETIGRLQKYAKEIISTIDRGTISFVTDGRLMEVETAKQK